MTTHFVELSFDFDDKIIQKRIEERGYDDLMDRLVKDCKAHVKYTNGANWKWSSAKDKEIDWDRYLDIALSDFIEKYKDEIIEKASNKLVESFKRTKAYKEKMAETLGDM